MNVVSSYKTNKPVGQNSTANPQMKAPLSLGGARGAGGEWGNKPAYAVKIL